MLIGFTLKKREHIINCIVMLQMPISIYHIHTWDWLDHHEVIAVQAFYWVIMKIRYNVGEKADSKQARELFK